MKGREYASWSLTNFHLSPSSLIFFFSSLSFPPDKNFFLFTFFSSTIFFSLFSPFAGKNSSSYCVCMLEWPKDLFFQRLTLCVGDKMGKGKCISKRWQSISFAFDEGTRALTINFFRLFVWTFSLSLAHSLLHKDKVIFFFGNFLLPLSFHDLVLCVFNSNFS